MKIEIENFELADQTMLSACVERAKRSYDHGDHDVVPVIWVSGPSRDGTLGYSIRLPYPSGGQMIVHAIRRPGSTEIEFHS